MTFRSILAWTSMRFDVNGIAYLDVTIDIGSDVDVSVDVDINESTATST